MNRSIRILLADDHKIILEGLSSLLEPLDEFEVVASVTRAKEAIQALQDHPVDVAVLDFEMPEMSGVELTQHIQKHHSTTKVLLLTMHGEHARIKEAVDADADGYILKERGSEELIEAIHTVMNGDKFFSPKVQNIILELAKGYGTESTSSDGMIRLTKREREVLQLLAEGLTSVQIADKLFVAQSTVETHRRNLLDKTGVANSRSLIMYALKQGWINQT